MRLSWKVSQKNFQNYVYLTLKTRIVFHVCLTHHRRRSSTVRSTDGRLASLATEAIRSWHSPASMELAICCFYRRKLLARLGDWRWPNNVVFRCRISVFVFVKTNHLASNPNRRQLWQWTSPRLEHTQWSSHKRSLV